MGAEELLDGFMKIVAVVYLLILCGWFGRELIGGFIAGQSERKEFKERRRAWKPETIEAGEKEVKLPAPGGKDAVLDPL